MPWKTIGEVGMGDCSFHPRHDNMLGYYGLGEGSDVNPWQPIEIDIDVRQAIFAFLSKAGSYPGLWGYVKNAPWQMITLGFGVNEAVEKRWAADDYFENVHKYISSSRKFAFFRSFVEAGDVSKATDEFCRIFNEVDSNDVLDNVFILSVFKKVSDQSTSPPVKAKIALLYQSLEEAHKLKVNTTREVMSYSASAPWTLFNVLGFLAIGYATYRVIGYTRDQWYGRKIRKLAEEEEDLVEEIRESAFERDEARKKRERLEKKRSRNWLFPDVVHDKSVVKSETEQPRRFPGVVPAASSVYNVLAAKEAKNRAFSEAVRETERVAPGKIIKSKGGRIDDKTKELYEGVAKELNKELEVQHGKGVKIPTDPSSKEFEKMKGALSRGMKI